MRIAIDMQGAQSESRNRGIGRYSLALAKHIAKHAQDNEIILTLNGLLPDAIENIKKEFKGLIPESSFRIWTSPAPVNFVNPESITNRAIAEITYEAFILEQQPDFIFITSLFEGLGEDAVCSIHQLQRSVPVATVLYDLIPLIYPEKYLSNPVIKEWYLAKLKHLKKADLLLSISESSRQEGIKLLSYPQENIVNISTDANSEFKPIPFDLKKCEAPSRYGLNKPFIMYTGGIDHRKNIDGLIRAFAKLPSNIKRQHQLAIICAIQPDSLELLKSIANQCGLNDTDIVFTGFVSNDELIELYNTCSLFVFPSLHEGFGLPILEAMRCGALVLCSDKSSLPEVIGDKEATFDPYSDTDIADAINRVLTNSVFADTLKKRQQLQVKKFSWDESAKRAIAAMNVSKKKQQITGKSEVTGKISKPKLAFISPIPSAKSGIADYSAELIVALAKYYEIDVFVEQSEKVSNHQFKEMCNIRNVDYLLSNHKEYSRVMYHFGNSSYHKHMFDLLEKLPGVVVLHDFFLSGILAYRENHYREENVWTRELLKSHGYQALLDKYKNSDISETVWKYPSNLSVLQQAKGIIFHSEHSVELIEQWYGYQERERLNVIPLLRIPPEQLDKNKAKKQLGFKETDLLVSTFGILGESKLNHKLLEAWLDSELAKKPNAYLIFIGEAANDAYCEELKQKIRNSQYGENIKITGWTSDKSYKQYLQATDIGVQLRCRSRGETSAAVLDCMNYGIATIVNAHGSMASLDPNAVIMLPDKLTAGVLSDALNNLATDDTQRAFLSQKSREVITLNHNPEYCAKGYRNAIESFYREINCAQESLTNNLINLNLAEREIKDASVALAKSFPYKLKKRQLLVDISELINNQTENRALGVVEELLYQFITNQPNDILVEPVYSTEDGGKGYRYARHFTCRMLNIPPLGLHDTPVDAWRGDLFISIDSQSSFIQHEAQVLKEWKDRGVNVWFMISDLLSTLKPKFFAKGNDELFKKWLKTISQFNGVACTSKAATAEYSKWLEDNGFAESDRPKIGWFQLGSDLDENLQANLYANVRLPSQLKGLGDAPVFLMVVTVEPRKGHAEVVAAFDQLWRDGVNAHLVIVGKQGWLVEDCVNTLTNHAQNGNKLHWLSSVNDAELKQIYQMSTCLIAASEGEGLGLPLIEASQFKLPIIARDIPVFREVAGDGAFYFDSKGTTTLAKAISDWLSLYKENAHPCSTDIECITWRESASDLLTLIKNS